MTTLQRLTLLAVFSFTATALYAQPSGSAADRGLPSHLRAGEQLAQVLTSPAADARAQGLTLANQYARLSPEVDLTPAVPALVAIYRNAASEQARISAAAALQAIGDESGMQALRDGVSAQASTRVQHVSLAALLAHYGPATFEDDPALLAVATALQDQNAVRFSRPQAG